VDAEYRFGSGRDRPGQLIAIHIERQRINVDEDRPRAAKPNGICGCDVGVTDRDHLVIDANANSKER
jgi:hypothetical protein